MTTVQRLAASPRRVAGRAPEVPLLVLPDCQLEPTRSELLLGPPHTGLNHLAEFLFLMHMGTLQWSEVARHAEMRLRDLRSEEGLPVYASFYYTWESFSLENPMAAYRIDDLLTFFSAVRLWGGTAIDGWHAMCREGDELPARLTPPDMSRVPRVAGPAWVRMSNVFVKMRSGPQDLEVALPCNLDASRFHRGADCLETYRLVKEVRQLERFPRPKSALLMPRPVSELRYETRVNPDRDINGVGLVYFANYVTFLDAAERELLAEVLAPESREWRIDRRTLIEREIAYFGNATAGERLEVGVRATELRSAESAWPDRTLFWLDYTIRRVSDGELICVSRAIKRIPTPRRAC